MKNYNVQNYIRYKNDLEVSIDLIPSAPPTANSIGSEISDEIK